MKMKEIADIAGHEVISSTTNRCRKKLVIIGIAAHSHVREVDHKFCNFPQYKRHIENTLAQPVPIAKARAV